MSLEEKIKNAKKSEWLTEGIPKWRIKWISQWALFKVKVWRFIHNKY